MCPEVPAMSDRKNRKPTVMERKKGHIENKRHILVYQNVIIIV